MRISGGGMCVNELSEGVRDVVSAKKPNNNQTRGKKAVHTGVEV